MKRHISFAIFTVICSLILISSAWAKPPAHARNRDNRADTIVETNYGRLMGDLGENNTWVWKSVPYAQPPVGELRWKAPEDPLPWKGVRQAKKECVPCTQLETSVDWIRQNYAIGSEDCLYLNIWRPRTDEQLPVYVYIHGGSNNFGQASDYNGAVLASESNVVVIVIQYRLGPLGWFTHPALRNGDALDNSGNFGTLDTIKALEWIQDNISAFGGDPSNVLLTGESAGAHNTTNLIISPLAAGLFHKAMSQSGGMVPKTVQVGENLANSTIDRLLVADGTAADSDDATTIRTSMTDEQIESYLRNKTGHEIYEVLAGNIGTYDAYIDGVVIPGTVTSTIESGDYNKVPIILGANEYESKAFMPLYGPALGLPWNRLRQVLTGEINSVADVLPTQNERDLYELAGWYGSRNWRAKFVDEVARALADQPDQVVYAYQFNWDGWHAPGSNHSYWDGWDGMGSDAENVGFIYGAGHAKEISFFFGSDTSLWGFSYSPGNDTAGRVDLKNKMMGYLANFAHHGDPNENDLPQWDQWDNTENAAKVIMFDADDIEAKISMDNEELLFAEIGLAYFVDVLSRQVDDPDFWNFTLGEGWGWVPGFFLWQTAD